MQLTRTDGITNSGQPAAAVLHQADYEYHKLAPCSIVVCVFQLTNWNAQGSPPASQLNTSAYVSNMFDLPDHVYNTPSGELVKDTDPSDMWRWTLDLRLRSPPICSLKCCVLSIPITLHFKIQCILSTTSDIRRARFENPGTEILQLMEWNPWLWIFFYQSRTWLTDARITRPIPVKTTLHQFMQHCSARNQELAGSLGKNFQWPTMQWPVDSIWT